MNISLKDQVVLITGASRGIGKAITRLLAQANASVAIHYNHSREAAQALAEESGNRAQAFQADLSNPSACQKLAEDVLQHYGRIDALVNNAGVAIETRLDQDFDTWVQAWQQTLQVNLLATAALCRSILPHFIENNAGRIVQIASRAAFRGDTPDYMAYAASKAGMVAYSRSLSRGYGKAGIKSFVVAPGFTRTEMAQQFIDVYGEEIAMKGIALDRLTEPEDIAPTVLFLLSGHMDHATGCTIDINAGSYVH